MALRSQGDTFISLFAGAGGLDLSIGLALPDARCVCYVEREVEAAEILVARMRDEALDDAPVWSDVSTFDGKPWRGLVDGIAGGFPCQDLSVAGKRRGFFACADCGRSADGVADAPCAHCGGEIKTTRSGLFYEYARIIREVEPRWVYIENVPAVLAFPAGGIVLGELAAMGFDAEWGTLRARDVGASHQRKRCFVLAYKRGERWRASRPWDDRRYERHIANSIYGDVGHSEMWRRNDSRHEGRDYESSWPFRGSGGELGHADDAGLEGRRYLAGECGDERSAGQAGSDMGFVFAPGPGAAIWHDVLVRDYGMRPALSQAEAESCLRRVADGLASPLDQRIDRLRACGNGVVAIQGAAALVELMRRAMGE